MCSILIFDMPANTWVISELENRLSKEIRKSLCLPRDFTTSIILASKGLWIVDGQQTYVFKLIWDFLIALQPSSPNYTNAIALKDIWVEKLITITILSRTLPGWMAKHFAPLLSSTLDHKKLYNIFWMKQKPCEIYYGPFELSSYTILNKNAKQVKKRWN
jgi:hypothetical protein